MAWGFRGIGDIKTEILLWPDLKKNNVFKSFWLIAILLTFLAPNKIRAQETSEEQKPINEIYCSCIQTARLAGVKIPAKTDAEHIEKNSYPVIGGLILFYYPTTRTYHAAVIKEFKEKGFWVYEGNFKPCEADYRLVSYNDKFITGFTLKNKVEIKNKFLSFR